MLTLALKEDDRTTARICFNDGRLGALGRLHASVVDISSRLAPGRARVENFIRATYTSAYDADIAVDYPVLMSVRDENGMLFAAAGFRIASDEKLFLEQYMSLPVEEMFRDSCGIDAARAGIAEVGNLASSGHGGTVFLYAALAAHLEHLGILHVAATCTPVLQRQLTRLGFGLHRLCAASPAAIGGVERWGRYYNTAPQVCCGSIAGSDRLLKKRLGAEYRSCRAPLFARLHPKVTR